MTPCFWLCLCLDSSWHICITKQYIHNKVGTCGRMLIQSWEILVVMFFFFSFLRTTAANTLHSIKIKEQHVAPQLDWDTGSNVHKPSQWERQADGYCNAGWSFPCWRWEDTPITRLRGWTGDPPTGVSVVYPVSFPFCLSLWVSRPPNLGPSRSALSLTFSFSFDTAHFNSIRPQGYVRLVDEYIFLQANYKPILHVT